MGFSNCVPWCCVAFAMVGLFAGSQYVKLRKKHLHDQNVYSEQSKETHLAYQRIVKERAHIFSRSILIGLVIASISAYYLYQKDRAQPLSIQKIICFMVSVSLFVTYVAYQLSPKSDYMLYHMTDPSQIKEWVKIYRSFQVANYIGLVLGIIVYALWHHLNH